MLNGRRNTWYLTRLKSIVMAICWLHLARDRTEFTGTSKHSFLMIEIGIKRCLFKIIRLIWIERKGKNLQLTYLMYLSAGKLITIYDNAVIQHDFNCAASVALWCLNHVIASSINWQYIYVSYCLSGLGRDYFVCHLPPLSFTHWILRQEEVCIH